MTSEWRIDAEPDADRSYEHLGLSRNPFSASGLAPERPDGLPLALVRPELNRFASDFIRTGSFQAAVVVGAYGSGKTHHMRLLERAFLAVPATRVVYLASAQAHPLQVVTAVLREIGTGELAKLVWRPVLEALRAVPDDRRLIELVGDEKYSASLPTNAVGLFPSRLLEPEQFVDYRTLIAAFQKRSQLSLKKLRTFALHTIAKDLQISLGSARLLFDTSEDEGMRAAGATDQLFSGRAPDSGPQEAEVLRALSELLHRDGTERLVILIDEFEGVSMLQRLTRRQSVDYLFALRMLVDQTAGTSRYALVVATTPTAYELAAEIYSAVSSRFAYVIQLPVLDERTAVEILSSALADARLTPSEGIHPFTIEFVRDVLTRGASLPRGLVVEAYRAIEQASLDKTVTDIGTVTNANGAT